MANNEREQVPLFEIGDTSSAGAWEALGKEFGSATKRRDHFLGELRQRLADLRTRPDFPVAEDEHILRLSDPPYFAACPNPFLGDIVRHCGRPSAEHVAYERSPFTGSMQASSRHPVYSFHPYSTKVPPDIIRALIEHYTDPGDLVFDGFCGTGMTGVAARECGRNAVLGDLSPAATFIASVNTRSHDWRRAQSALKDILRASKARWGHLYETLEGSRAVPVNYFVWSDVFTCPECTFEFAFFPHGVIHHGSKVETRELFPCPSCGAELTVRRVNRIVTREGKKRSLAWVNAGIGRKRISRGPNAHDLGVAREAEATDVPEWFPEDRVNPDGYSAKLAQLGSKGIGDVSRFLSKRNLIVLSDVWARVEALDDPSLRALGLATLTSVFTVISERQGYFGGGGGMSGNLYMPIVRMEKNVYDVVSRKLEKLVQAEKSKHKLTAVVALTTQSATDMQGLPDASVDYIYTDPPFGANIIYSEMNLLMEAWLRVKMAEATEAVIDETRGRGSDDYARLMTQAFAECYRILKPGHWMTVEFHNTAASVWNLIQNAIGESGFVVAQVGILDKGSTTILADIRPGAAKQDLLISAYKPNAEVERQFAAKSGTEAWVWDFVREHLRKLPVFVSKDGQVEQVGERQGFLLYDSMVAFHVQRGVAVPMSAAGFYQGLPQRFMERDDMYFLPEQAAEYDRKRMTAKEVLQLSLFVVDESSAIQWLRQQLTKKPQTFQELHPHFLSETKGWQKHEKALELLDLLQQNFLRYEGEGEVPAPIHAYLSTNFKELRNLGKGDPALAAKAKDRWYVPDPNKAGDLEKLRERALLKEFEEYRALAQRKLKVFRLEAVRAGFKKAWQDRDYATIIAVAGKIPEDVLQEDPKLLMWYDQAITRKGQ